MRDEALGHEIVRSEDGEVVHPPIRRVHPLDLLDLVPVDGGQPLLVDILDDDHPVGGDVPLLEPLEEHGRRRHVRGDLLPHRQFVRARANEAAFVEREERVVRRGGESTTGVGADLQQVAGRLALHERDDRSPFKLVPLRIEGQDLDVVGILVRGHAVVELVHDVAMAEGVLDEALDRPLLPVRQPDAGGPGDALPAPVRPRDRRVPLEEGDFHLAAERLEVLHLDLFQVHRFTSSTRVDESLDSAPSLRLPSESDGCRTPRRMARTRFKGCGVPQVSPVRDAVPSVSRLFRR